MPRAANPALSAATVFGRRLGQPRARRAHNGLRLSPALLAYAFRREQPDSLRRLVLDRLYGKLTLAERRLCDAERARTVEAY